MVNEGLQTMGDQMIPRKESLGREAWCEVSALAGFCGTAIEHFMANDRC